MKDLLFCQPLEGRNTDEGISAELYQIFVANELSWKNCVGVCTDGSAEMTGNKRKRLFAQIIENE
jgi:hypothetical protein